MSNLFDLLTYRSYAHNRLESPEVSPERWARIFPNAAAMEKRFVREFEVALMQSTTGILDVAARNDGLSCSTVTYGATGGEATATASPLQSLPILTASAETGVQSTASDCAPENTSYFPLAETVEKIIANPRLTQKQRIDGEMRLIWKGRA